VINEVRRGHWSSIEANQSSAYIFSDSSFGNPLSKPFFSLSFVILDGESKFLSVSPVYSSVELKSRAEEANGIDHGIGLLRTLLAVSMKFPPF
jgi:hypothetical protein